MGETPARILTVWIFGDFARKLPSTASNAYTMRSKSQCPGAQGRLFGSWFGPCRSYLHFCVYLQLPCVESCNGIDWRPHARFLLLPPFFPRCTWPRAPCAGMRSPNTGDYTFQASFYSYIYNNFALFF